MQGQGQVTPSFCKKLLSCCYNTIRQQIKRVGKIPLMVTRKQHFLKILVIDFQMLHKNVEISLSDHTEEMWITKRFGNVSLVMFIVVSTDRAQKQLLYSLDPSVFCQNVSFIQASIVSILLYYFLFKILETFRSQIFPCKIPEGLKTVSH